VRPTNRKDDVTQSDAALVEASRRGDQLAFRRLVERYFRRVLAVAAGMLRNREDAQDVAQETFIKAYRNLGSFKGHSAFYTWLYRITVNLCIDLQRREARLAGVVDTGRTGAGEANDLEGADESPGADPFERVRSREIGAQVVAALDELTPEHRAIILLREVEGLSYEEISHVMQCAKGTVMSRLHYARKKLQSRLREYQ
jgi:RNA polymerase sigma-70 factor (ECF subfamily)